MSADPYTYPGLTVLRNKFDIEDGHQLQALEFQLSAMRTAGAIAFAEQHRHQDEQCWLGVHRILFGDIYAWAGNLRTVELAKGSSSFAPMRALNGYADREILPAFRDRARDAGTDELLFTAALAECWGELNFLHPFREGNGRSTQIFVGALAHRHGRGIDWSRVDRTEEIVAAIAAGNQNYQGYVALLAGAMTTP